MNNLSKLVSKKMYIGYISVCAIASGVYLSKLDATSNNNPLIGEKNPIISNKTGIASNNNPLIGEKNPIISNKTGITSNNNPLIGEKNTIISNKTGITSNKNPLIGEKNPVISKKDGVASNNNPIIIEKNPIISNKTSITSNNKTNNLSDMNYNTSSLDNSLMIAACLTDKNLFHYTFSDNVIKLFGDFKKTGNEVYKVDNNLGYDAFLYHKNEYYGMKNNQYNTPLQKIDNRDLINSLEVVRKSN